MKPLRPKNIEADPDCMPTNGLIWFNAIPYRLKDYAFSSGGALNRVRWAVMNTVLNGDPQ